MLAIYKREVRSYFQSMVGCVFVAFLIAFTGIYFMAYNLTAGYPYFSYTLSGTLIVFIVGIPLITMRSFSEERKNKTDQLLLTAPVSLWKVVLGKYLAMVTITAVPCVIYLIFPLIIKAQGTAYIKVDYLAILVFFLLGCVYISIGMFVSSLTESVIIAAIGAFGILLLTYLWSGILNFIPSAAWANALAVAVLLTLVVLAVWNMTKNVVISGVLELIVLAGTLITYFVKKTVFESLLSTVLGKLELTEVFSNIADNHLLDVNGIILYLSLIVLFFFLTMQMIQKRRWS